MTTLARCCRHADWPSARPSRTIPGRSSRDQTRASCKTLRNWISPKITPHGSSLNQHRIVNFWHFQFHHHHRTQSWEWQLLNQNKKRGFAEISLFCGQFDCLTSCDFYFRSLSNFGAIQICYQISIRNAPGRSRSGREGRKDPLFPSDEAEKIESENWNLWLWECRPQKAFCRTGPFGTWPQRDFSSQVWLVRDFCIFLEPVNIWIFITAADATVACDFRDCWWEIFVVPLIWSIFLNFGLYF